MIEFVFLFNFGGWILGYTLYRYFKWQEARDMSHVLDDPLVAKAALAVAFRRIPHGDD